MRRYISAVLAVGAVAGISLVANEASAAAAPDASLKITYQVNGSTVIKSVGATLPLGPGKLAASVNLNTAKITASLTLPPATGSFKEFGLIPVTATTAFVQDGPTTGTLNPKNGAVTTQSKITLQITSLTVAGLPVFVGNRCTTASPAVINLKSGKGFSPLKGGPISGSYTIGQFQHCALATLLINVTIPGSGNTLTLNLSKAKVG